MALLQLAQGRVDARAVGGRPRRRVQRVAQQRRRGVALAIGRERLRQQQPDVDVRRLAAAIGFAHLLQRRGHVGARLREQRLGVDEQAVRALAVDLAGLLGERQRELRNFAQSLSLDALLAAANHHLDQLAPRYQLERVPGLDLELHVIDREMGGDARAVNSLSGGESFLVSLALALGLSSMAAADVEVRTLFIDEGFGSLDPATLDSALG
ncbi:MAG: hypothetical protein K8J09_01950, partial [Planctomycetes bacterium]|nr:hypothetical protein [Planctomycetota bacterium]